MSFITVTGFLQPLVLNLSITTLFVCKMSIRVAVYVSFVDVDTKLKLSEIQDG